LIGDSQFQLVMDDPANFPAANVKRVLLCSGKIYFALESARQKAMIDDTAIVRVEQPYPFPTRELTNIFAKYKEAREICWVQEEPKNRGCWSFMEPRVRELLPSGATLTYFGRKEAASPATGSHHMHEVEEQEILTQALDLNNRKATITEIKDPVAKPAATSESTIPVSK